MEKKTVVRDLITGEDRPLAGLRGFSAENCRFEGRGGSGYALKDAGNGTVKGCLFAMPYPLWHATGVTLLNSRLTEDAKDPFWYCEDLKIGKTFLHAGRGCRECRGVVLSECDVAGNDFGWRCADVTIGKNSRIRSDRALFESTNVRMRDTNLNGDDALQYVRDGEIIGCVVNANDFLWRAENVTLTDCVINGDRIGWYSENLRFVRCRIAGNMPFCFCGGLVLEDCSMEGCESAFEHSSVEAMISGSIGSVRNPAHGSISADDIGSVVIDGNRLPGSDCAIRTKR